MDAWVGIERDFQVYPIPLASRRYHTIGQGSRHEVEPSPSLPFPLADLDHLQLAADYAHFECFDFQLTGPFDMLKSI